MKFFKILSLFIFLFPLFCFADSYLDKNIFFVDPDYDLFGRKKILATNLQVSERAYFYVEDEFFDQLSSAKKQKIYQQLKNLAEEFDKKIYPKLTSILGKDPKYGLNKDKKITILLHQIEKGVGGYFREADYFEKAISPYSNERKMIYLNISFLGEEIIRSNLAHEFCHLIIFNQKRKILNVEEERWLQEMIADTAPTILGYKENLKRRLEIFKQYPKDPILEWKNLPQDYGAVAILGHYLLEQFGNSFYKNLLKTKKTGILAIEAVTKKDFANIFKNWMVAVYLNDCSFGKEFCFINENLKNLKILPEIQFLPITGESVLTIFRKIKDFSGDWQKVYGGKGNLILEFDGEDDGEFELSYILCDKKGKCEIEFLNLDKFQDATISVPNFDKNYSSLLLLTFSKKNKKAFEGEASFYNFSVKISFKKETSPPVSPLPKISLSCEGFLRNLRMGMSGEDVKCLQKILKEEEVYPEGKITGYFGPLTFNAVIRFQEKYKDEILAPWGLKKGTGFVGETTRKKLNQILGKTFVERSICEGVSFSRNLRFGSFGKDVKCLQYILNQDPKTKLANSGPGSPGNETFFFGPKTFDAVIRFQEKYKKEILAPWGLEKGTGFVGPTTRKKLNQLLSQI